MLLLRELRPHEKRCFKRDFYIPIRTTKRIKMNKIKRKRRQRKTIAIYDGCKIVEFRKEKNRWIISYKGMINQSIILINSRGMLKKQIYNKSDYIKNK